MHQKYMFVMGSCLLFSTEVDAQVEPQTSIPLKTCTMNDADWQELIQSSLTAYKEMDTATFQQKRAEVYNHVFCLSSIIGSESVADFHHMEVLNAFMDKDKAAFAAHVRAAEIANPVQSLPELGLVNDGHPILQWYALAKDEKIATRIRLPLPALGHSIFIDGSPATGYPSDLPYVFQRVVDGKLEESKIVRLDDPVPTYPLFEDPTLRVALEPRMAWISAGAFGVALTTATAASLSERKFWNPATANEDLVSLQNQTNLYSGVALAGVCVGTGALVMSIWEGRRAVTVH